MREIGLLSLILFASMQFSQNIDNQIQSRNLASQEQAECVYKAHDLPKEIIGKGSTMNDARADASHQCFDIRMDHYEATHPQEDYDVERGYAVANACTNISCEM